MSQMVQSHMGQVRGDSAINMPPVMRDIQGRRHRNFLYFTLIVLLFSRLCFQLGAAPFPDEAYYWLWGIHLDLSYFDHPPLHAWLQGLDAHILGWSAVGLRFLTWPTTAGTVAILLWCGKRAPHPRGSFSLATISVYFASPIIFIYTTVAYNDHLLIFLSYLSFSFFTGFLEESAASKQRRFRYLYLGAFILGLAALTKYNAVFLGLGLASAVIALPVLRPLLRSPHLYAAAAVTALLQLPVFYWNAINGLSSFRYNLWDRLHPEKGWMTGLLAMGGFVATSAVLLSPFLVPALVRFLTTKPHQTSAAIWQSLGAWTFSYSTMFLLLLSFAVYVHFYWNIEAYLIFLPAALGYLQSGKLLRAHLVFGMVASLLFTFNYTVLPLTAIWGQADFESSRAFGWGELGSRVAAAKTLYRANFVASSNWQAASQLAFAMHDPTVECIGEKSQFTFWLDHARRKGQDAIILIDESQLRMLDKTIRPQFRSLELVDTVPVVRFERTLTIYQIYRGTSYIGRDGRTGQ
jgi:4-amino-4-deoxy-L-arabinose transferase-like glycosyltransferase